ncbi:MAG: hypothetical protein HKN43_11520 [Rhodothermales bacterium]|nr:hypothetical protein [Rhodothermales bacterium]
MRSILSSLAFVFLTISFTGWSMPDDRVVEIWECTVKEGKMMEAVHEANSAWVQFMNANVEGGDIRSYVLTPKVGEREPRGFMFIDSYPSLASWAAGDAAIETDAGKAVQAALNELLDCSENEMHMSRQSE